MGVRYRLVIEEQEWTDYRRYEPPENLVVLDMSYRDRYDDLRHLLGGTQVSTHSQSKGSGPARNFLWEHSIAEGHAWHWTMDDNIRGFGRMHGNNRHLAQTGALFFAMEDWALRYQNLAMCGPGYEMFAFCKNQERLPPLVLNTRIFSCNLIRNDIPFRWRGRYNEDAILSLDVLKAGWCTAQFVTFFQRKVRTQTMKGGNAEIYAKGTLDKSRMLVAAHPDMAQLATKFQRDHHHVNYRVFKQKLRLRPEALEEKRAGSFEYGMRLVPQK
jgi:TET-Associated Glycosyltransferase